VTWFCEHGSELSGSIRGESFCEELSDYELVNKNCPWS
jgi:hypothetical protein